MVSKLNLQLSQEIEKILKETQPFKLQNEIVSIKILSINLDEEYAQNCPPTINFSGCARIGIDVSNNGDIMEEVYNFSGSANVKDFHVLSITPMPIYLTKK